MKKIKSYWEKINRYVIYITLLFMVIFQIIELVFPNVLISYPTEMYLIAICAVLFIGFEHIVNLESLCNTKADIQSSSSFSQGMSNIMNDHHTINNLDIFSHTSMVHYQYIYDSHIRIRNLRLLVLNPYRKEGLYSLNREEEERFANETQLAIRYWKILNEQGYIENLTIKFYDFYPTFYFSIIDKSNVHWGLFLLQKRLPSTCLLSHHTVYSKNTETNSMISDFQKFFDSVFELSVPENSLCTKVKSPSGNSD